MFKIISTCKGGGYMYCKTDPVHPKANSNNLYPLHRVVMENKLGRILLPDEIVHHIDEDKSNNNESNLMVLSVSDHAKLHRPEVDPVEVTCICNKKFKVKPSIFRRKMKISVTKTICCSRKCSRYNQDLYMKSNL